MNERLSTNYRNLLITLREEPNLDTSRVSFILSKNLSKQMPIEISTLIYIFSVTSMGILRGKFTVYSTTYFGMECNEYIRGR